MLNAPASAVYDTQAEEMLLGAFLLRPELLDASWATLSDEAFYAEANRTVYGIMRRQMAQFGYVGVHTVMMDLRLANQHELCPRVPGMLSAFCEQHPETSDIAELCAVRVSDLYRARETDLALGNARQKARDGVPLTEVQMEVKALLRAINSTDGDSNMPSIDELLEQKGEVTVQVYRKVSYISKEDAGRLLQTFRSTLPLPGWVPLQETARRAGVTPEAVSKWAKRNGFELRFYRHPEHHHIVHYLEAKHAERYIAKTEPRRIARRPSAFKEAA